MLPFRNIQKLKPTFLITLKPIPVIVGFIGLLYNSLHIEWIVTVKAVSHMIKNAYLKKEAFIREKFSFMEIGTETVINDKVLVLMHTYKIKF